MIVAGVWTGVGFSNLKNSQTRIQKFWNRSRVRVWVWKWLWPPLDSSRALHLVYKSDEQISRHSNSQVKILNLFESLHVPAAQTSKAKLQMTNYTNITLFRDRKRWRIDNGELGEKIGILLGPTKKWRIKWIDELNEFYCRSYDW